LLAFFATTLLSIIYLIAVVFAIIAVLVIINYLYFDDLTIGSYDNKELLCALL